MTDGKWLDRYSGQTTDELIALQGEYRTDSIVLAFEQALSRKAERIGPEGLTEEEGVVLAVDAIDRVMEDVSDERDDRLGECDARYYRVVGDLAGPLLEFIKGNRDKIKLRE